MTVKQGLGLETVANQEELFSKVSSARIHEYRVVKDASGTKYVVYMIRLTAGTLSWEVARRYNDFRKLHEELARKGVVVPALPPKRMFGGFSRDFLEHRRHDLEAYLGKLIDESDGLRTSTLRSFIWQSHQWCSLEEAAPGVDSHGVYNEEEDVHNDLNDIQNIIDMTDDGGMIEDDDDMDDDFFSPMGSPVNQIASGHSLQAMSLGGDNSGVASDFEARRENPPLHTGASNREQQQQQRKAKKPSLDDFEMVRVLGKGSFGKVMLCRKKDTQQLYAMKVLKKEHVLKRKQVAHTRTERSVLGLVDHPFVVKLYYAFQTGDKLHFVLDFCSGGELFFHLGRAGRFSEGRGRFYTAEIALALGHLHTKSVVYRDLKPENILLDSEGHIKLADFGLSKEGVNSGESGARSFCGTPEYLAPEVLNRTGHGTSVDWWSLGALLYEMLTGLPPWYSQDRQKMFASIRNSVLDFPEYISPLARGILSDFLTRDVTKRLGSKNDVDDVKQHRFFHGVNWDALYNRQIPAPFVPRLQSQTDTANFDAQFTRMPINSVDAGNFGAASPSVRNAPPGTSDAAGGIFDGFTYVERSGLAEHMAHLSTNSGIERQFGSSMGKRSLVGSYRQQMLMAAENNLPVTSASRPCPVPRAAQNASSSTQSNFQQMTPSSPTTLSSSLMFE